ncbi:MAG: metalloregulator ArsR/SmtB family transcription factor [Rhodanobacteraceae bacterium]
MQHRSAQGGFQERTEEVSSVLKALGNPRRLHVLRLLTMEELSAAQINDHFPDLSQSALAQHLARLREQGLVLTRRQSQTVFYSLAAGSTQLIMTALNDIYFSVAS